MTLESAKSGASPGPAEPLTGGPPVASGTARFYADLAPIATFEHATDITNYVELPDDWLVVVTDVIGSTKAIEAGAYKKVNTVGVAGIAAICNAVNNLEIPFVFGGDGTTCAVPAALTAPVRVALLGARRLARDGFGLDLRLGMVPVGDLRAAGHWVRVAKVRQSEHVTQSAFAGRGWEIAEKWVKDPAKAGRYEVAERPEEAGAEADFSGFECRWQGVQAVHDHKLAILVQGVSSRADINMRTYQEVLDRIAAIYGSEADYHPLRAERLRLSRGLGGTLGEAQVRTFGGGRLAALAYGLRAVVQNVIAMVLFTRGIKTAAVDWSRYRTDLVANSDFRKFDGMLRMVIDGREDQATALRADLERLRSEGRVVYGLHKSKEALVTCIVRSYNGDHRHFVDGGDGGYALAARELKGQLAALNSPG